MKSPSTGEVACVSSTVGGSLSTVYFRNNTLGRQANTSKVHSCGIKGPVKGFSKVSRRNLLRRLASINRRAFRTSRVKVITMTLTYPHLYPKDPGTCKCHLKAFRKRLERRYGPFAAFWRMGIQRRGAFHFHLLLFLPPSFGSLQELRRFVSSAWYEVCGKVSEGHLRAGTHVNQVRNWKKATSYAERYLAKEEEFPEDMQTGRIWGEWNQDLLPVRWERVRVSLRDAYRIRRVFRKLAGIGNTGSLRRLTVFVGYENVVRLLGYLGYQQLE
jgi:hypothetical protein